MILEVFSNLNGSMILRGSEEPGEQGQSRWQGSGSLHGGEGGRGGQGCASRVVRVGDGAQSAWVRG